MKTKSRSSLVLMELIITILLFSFCSAVCVQLFVQSHLINKETDELNFAIACSQGFAEVMRGTDGYLPSIQEVFPNAVGDGYSYFQLYYDKDFKELDAADSSEAVYVADITLERISKIQYMNIKIVRLSDYETIHSLVVSKYLRE